MSRTPAPPRPRPGSAPAGAAGFTLLEVLVALVVLGLLMVGLTQGAQLGLSAWIRQDRAIAARAELDAVDRALRRLIGRADPGTTAEPLGITGAGAGLRFVSELPEGAALLANRRAEMALLIAPGRRLVLRWAPYLHARHLGPPPPPQDVELLRGVARLELSYLPPDGGAWQASWTDHTLPALVRLRLIFGEDDARRWPDIVVAPMLGQPGGTQVSG